MNSSVDDLIKVGSQVGFTLARGPRKGERVVGTIDSFDDGSVYIRYVTPCGQHAFTQRKLADVEQIA